MSSVFSGAKIAILNAGKVLTLRRDDRADIPWPGMWDLPGGGREMGETPLDCAIRETREEAGVMLSPGDVVWEREFFGVAGRSTWFLVARPGWLCLPMLKLGDEGSLVRWMPVAGFLALTDAVPHLQARLGGYLAEAEVRPEGVPMGTGG